MALRAAIFDMDGVVTDTTKLHFKAWQNMFNAFLKRYAQSQAFFTSDDYLYYLDGKPRFEGIKSFLNSRGLGLPLGTPEDNHDKNTIYGLGNWKNAIFNDLVDHDGVDIFSSTIELIKKLCEQGIKTAIVSSSKNCVKLLERAQLNDLFAARVDGNVLQKLGLNGKPHPDMFLEAAARLQTSPLDCVIFEDALSGVQAGARGYFGLVVGIARQPDMRGPLKQMGADWVVDDLDAVTVNQLVEKMPDSLPNALECLPCIAEQSAYKKMVVFLDYDGTLTPIVDKPEKAILSDEMKAVLIKLSQKASVVVLSGRQLSNLQELIGLESLFYAGNHGFEIFNPLSNDTIVIVTEYKETISNAYNLLHQLLQDVQGVIIEHKALSLSIHYRLVKAEDVPIIEENLNKVLELHPQLKKHHGKKVFELRPHIDWDKGKALLHILEILSHHYAHIYPIFLGDDVTDEDAFMAIEDCGVGILVSKEQRRTSAAMVLEDPKQVEQFLEALTHLA
ncbi:trehalose-phosphatase [Coxiella burnetii]|uniref:trehalose-phosphatase n=1 Tax=Coxiella burnetii TaxID=777 RepID=UPI0002DE0581|nr:trehalose-phosphatase [Coxiella burnetii]ATN85752.1 hypothetical protein AYO29_04370 [Coxiella burnetii str. Schperling]